MVILLNTCVIGQTYQLDRDVDTDGFKCPHCSHTSTTIRLIQRHCKDHVANSTVKRTASRYHPYTNDQPTHNAHTIGDTSNTGQNQNDMDIDSELFDLIFPLMYTIEFYKMLQPMPLLRRLICIQLAFWTPSISKSICCSGFSYACFAVQPGLHLHFLDIAKMNIRT
jgi:hypothetical protein